MTDLTPQNLSSLYLDDSGPVCVTTIESTWRDAGKKKKKVKDEGIQVHLSHRRHGKGIQTTEKVSAGAQTVDPAESVTIPKKVDDAGLVQFLRKHEPEVTRLLTTNSSVRAFDQWMPNWEEDESGDSLVKNFTLTFGEGTSKQGGVEAEVSALAWNSNGSVVGVAFGSRHHSTWCSDHKGAIATWNVDRGVRLRPNEPDQWQETTSCLMTLGWHPSLPPILAAGNFLGEILIWNWSKKEDPLLGQTEAETSGHREPISQVRWLSDDKSSSVHRRQRLVTSGTDGRVVVWQIALSHPSRLIEPLKTIALKASDIPKDLKKNILSKGKGLVPVQFGKRETGINCMVFCLDDSSHLILGNETGAIFRATTGAIAPVGEPRLSEKSHASKKSHHHDEWEAALRANLDHSPVVLAFEPSDGPIYGVDFSPFHRNLFLACGADGTIRLYHQFQAAPCLTVTPPLESASDNAAPLLSVKWSPKRPLVFAVCTASGLVCLYDLSKSATMPYTKFRLHPDHASLSATSLAFNPRLPLLGVGVSDGSTQIWRIPIALTERIPRALQILSKIAGEEEEAEGE